MKQLLPLFLFLLPCLALAQYPSNGNQKITLGEQTTADGLIYRGVAADTTTTVKSDTAAYFVLDTVNINLYTYKASATGRKWRQLGADTAAIAYVNTYGTQTVNGAKTFTSAVTATRFNPTASTVTGTGMYLPSTNTLGFSTKGTNKMTIDSNGNVGFLLTPENSSGAWRNLQFQNGNFAFRANIDTDFFVGSNFLFKTDNSLVRKITGAVSFIYFINDNITFKRGASGSAGTTISFLQSAVFDENGNLGIAVEDPTEKLHIVGNARITAVGAGAYANDLNITSTGVLTTASSDEKYKYNILPINYGLNTILQLNPVNFQWIKGEENDLGFIAQDVAEIIPEAVDTNWNSDLLMRYESIIPILTKAIQEQQALIKALEQRLLILENK
jgi:hypothetical protein